MKVHGDYKNDGYARLENLFPAEVASALLDQFWRAVHGGGLPYSLQQDRLLTKKAVELHGVNFPAITTFLWGVTPTMESMVGCELLPTFAFFRLYQGGDRLRVHHDRPACEHSLSLTLGYSDGLPWPLDIGHEEAVRDGKAAEDFGDEPHSTFVMNPGDAVVYRGVRRRHARLTPNPNKWSAHLFLHWVDRAGPYRSLAFEHSSAAATNGN